jgi:hypothetical protein
MADSGTVPDPAAKRKPAARSANVPIASRAASVILPVTGGKSVKTSFFVSGFALTTAAGQATLVFDINGTNTVVKFPPNSEKSFVQKIAFKGKAVSEVRLTAFVLAERESTNAQSAAFIVVDSIDNDLALAAKKKDASKPKS